MQRTALSMLIPMFLVSCSSFGSSEKASARGTPESASTVRTVQSNNSTVELKIGDQDSFVWKIRPDKDLDVVQIYCPSDDTIDVQFNSEVETAIFQLSGLDYIEFEILDGNGTPALTAIECFPQPINFKGDYAVTSGKDRDYRQDLNSGTLDAHIGELMEKRAVPGLSVTVIEDRTTLFQRSYGLAELDGEIPFTNDTQSRIASATKFLTMLTIVSLVEEGEIDINVNLGTYLPEVHEEWADIPIWRILNHTSGLPEILNHEAFLALSDHERGALSYREIFDMIKDSPLDFEPGAGFRYQQSGYTLLAMILTERTGKTWDRLLAEHVLEPAGMTATSYGDWLTDHPRSYNLSKGELISPPYYYPPTLSTGAGYNATANDLAKLLMGLNEEAIIPLEFLKNIAFHVEYLPDTEGYGAGTVVKIFGDTVTMGHSGGGDMADIRYAPDLGIGIVVISNREGSDIATSITTEISELLFGQRPAD